MHKPFNKKIEWEIKSRQGLFSTFFVIGLLLVMCLLMIKTGYFLLSLGYVIGILWYIFSVRKLNTIKGFESEIEVFNFWTKKKKYLLSYNEIKRIEVRYWSDIPGRTKIITFHMKSNKKVNANILGVYMNDFNKFFLEKEIPVYIELNSKFVKYNPR